ncbi:MAG: hypothetical protein J7K32_05225 [Deltaproteobacteria bacterium]|nr:hypothetical protein [Deltaproteobacteria bacterium]
MSISGNLLATAMPDWDFLLGLDLDILSLDIYTNAEVFSSYAPAIKRFLNSGGVKEIAQASPAPNFCK